MADPVTEQRWMMKVEKLEAERDRYREALELIAAGMESAKSIAEVTLRPVVPKEGEK